MPAKRAHVGVMNAVSVNVSAYCDLEKISSDKFDPLIMNRKVENLLP